MTRSVQNSEIKTGLKGLFLFLLTIFLVTPVMAFEYSADPEVLFQRMSSRDGSELYRGLFTYERGGQLTTLSIERADRDGVLFEQVDVLDGPAWELSRRAGRVACEIGEINDEQTASNEIQSLSLNDYYEFYFLGETRIAGRDAQEILLVPLDPYRLTYSYSIDNETAMLLKSIAMQPDRTVLERMQFIEYELVESGEQPLEESAIDPVRSEDLNDWLNRCKQAFSGITGWMPKWVPQGFVLAEAGTDFTSGLGRLVYTDGIGAITITVRPVVEIEFPTATAQRGASAVHVGYIKLAESVFQVTVAGEVPDFVVTEIAKSMSFVADNSSSAVEGEVDQDLQVDETASEEAAVEDAGP